MATTVRPAGAGIISTVGAQKEAQVAGGLGFDWAAVALGSVFAGGVYLDGWAHNHGKVDNTFFTIWHAALYSGYALYAAFLVISLVRNHARGYEWQRALPAGYEASLLGAIVFAVGGVGDLIWHTIFGVETNTAALLSPTHLILALGLVLMVGGPLRAAWVRWCRCRARSRAIRVRPTRAGRRSRARGRAVTRRARRGRHGRAARSAQRRRSAGR